MKRIKYSNLQLQPGPPGARALLTVKFMDDDGEVYSWMPTWAEAEQLFLKAINTESFNKPESDWLPRFANTVQETAEAVNQPIQQARKIYGVFDSLNEGKLVIHTRHSGGYLVQEVTPLFPVDYEFLTLWLGRQITAIEINGIGVKLWHETQNGRREEYPGSNGRPPDSGPPMDDVDDLPF